MTGKQYGSDGKNFPRHIQFHRIFVQSLPEACRVCYGHVIWKSCKSRMFSSRNKSEQIIWPVLRHKLMHICWNMLLASTARRPSCCYFCLKRLVKISADGSKEVTSPFYLFWCIPPIGSFEIFWKGKTFCYLKKKSNLDISKTITARSFKPGQLIEDDK